MTPRPGAIVRLSPAGRERYHALPPERQGTVTLWSKRIVFLRWAGEAVERSYAPALLEVVRVRPRPTSAPPLSPSTRNCRTAPPGQGWAPPRYRGRRRVRDLVREHVAEIAARERQR